MPDAEGFEIVKPVGLKSRVRQGIGIAIGSRLCRLTGRCLKQSLGIESGHCGDGFVCRRESGQQILIIFPKLPDADMRRI